MGTLYRSQNVSKYTLAILGEEAQSKYALGRESDVAKTVFALLEYRSVRTSIYTGVGPPRVLSLSSVRRHFPWRRDAVLLSQFRSCLGQGLMTSSPDIAS